MAVVKVKIVHVTTLHPTFDIRIFHKECRSLAEAGYDVTLIAPHDRTEVVKGVRVIGIPRYRNRLWRMLAGGWRAYSVAKGQRAAIYHFHDPELLPWMARLKRQAHVIYDVHEDLQKAVLTKSWLPSFLRPRVAARSRRAERRYSRGMHLVLAEHSYEASYDWSPSTTVLNLPRLDELTAVSEQKYEQPTVVYFGGVNPSRGSLTMLHALGRLRAEGLAVALECIGPVSAAHRGELERTARQAGVAAHIRGYMPATEGWRIVARCHAGLALLHPLPNYLESYPTKVFEYMALGLPVVASDFPLYRELVADTGCGLCVDPLDVDAIAEAIRRLIEDSALAAELGSRGRTVAQERYDWQPEARKLAELYARLAQDSAE